MANFEARSTPRDRSLLYLQDGDHHRSARLFNGGVDPLEVIKPRRCDEHLWRLSDKIPDRVRKYIKNAGFDGVLRTDYHKFDHALITALVERWRPDTHTFHFPVGEATVTLQDVQVLWALPIDGPVVSGIYETKTPEEWSVEVFEYMGFYADEDEVKGGRINLSRLIAEIRSDCEKGKDNYKKRARVYILALLGGHLFSDANSVDVSLNFLKNIDKLSVRRRQSWGSAVLAYLYRQLCNVATNKDVKGIQGPLILLQIWAWERMPQIAPRILLVVGPIHYPHCYATRWNRPLNHTWTPSHVLVTYRAAFTGLREGDFEWCPYDGPGIMASLPTDCKSHRELWHYYGWMVFWNVTEPHVPNRVSRQFGYVQGVPEPLYIFPIRQHLDDHKDKLSGGRGTNWLEKKAAKVDCWKIRNSNIYQFSGPAGVGVTPAYMPWFYDRTVLVITSPGLYDVDVSYCKAWNARRIAIERLYGTWESNFAELPKYIQEMVHRNPGTIVRWLHAQNANPGGPAKFRYVFWAFGPAIQAFRYCIPYVVVDGTHLKGNYRGKLLTAVTKNANGNILPLAFAMVDNESNESWRWFLHNFRNNVAAFHSARSLCVISDRHPGLINAMDEMEDWQHRYCLRHIRSNLMTKFKDQKLKKWCWQIGTTTQRRKYRFAVDKLRGINRDAWRWLKEIGVEKWTLLHDVDYVRWGNTTSNNAESYNNVIRTVRMMPIKACIEGTFELTRAHFVQNFERSRDCNSPLSTAMWRIYNGRESYAIHQRVTPYNVSNGIYECQTNDPITMGGGNTYEVTFPGKSCTCGKWQMQRFICSHGMAVDGHVNGPTRRNHEVAPIMVSDFYSTEKWRRQYIATLRGLRHKDYWREANWTIEADSRMIITKGGRKKERRIRNEMDQPTGSASRPRTCSGCGQTGHNSRSRNCPRNQH